MSGVIVSEFEIILAYQYRRDGEEWKQVRQSVRMEWTHCNYGGERPWLICPAVGCGKRVGILYCCSGYFRCRHCCGLAYRSQREGPADRALTKAQDTYRWLGGSGSIGDVPDKPKGMHWKTYARLMLDARENESTSLWMVARKFDLRP